MSFESPDFDCCERLRQAVIGLERAVAGGAKLPEGASVADMMVDGGVDAAEMARLEEENAALKAKQDEAKQRLDRLIGNLSEQMELDA